MPRGDVGFGAVVRIDVGDALAEPLGAVAVERHEDERLVVDAAEAGLEEGDERQPQQPQPQPLDAEHGPISTIYSRRIVEQFRYIAIEGPLGVGKTALADRLGARLDATVVLDETENPFLADFYGGRPGAAFQAQLFFTLARHRQQTALRQSDLFSQVTVCDYLFDATRSTPT